MNFKLLNKDTVVCTFFITTLEYGMSCNVLKIFRTRISILVGNYRKIRVAKDRDNIVDRMVRLQLKRIGVNVTVERITEKSDSEICVQGSIAKI